MRFSHGCGGVMKLKIFHKWKYLCNIKLYEMLINKMNGGGTAMHHNGTLYQFFVVLKFWVF